MKLQAAATSRRPPGVRRKPAEPQGSAAAVVLECPRDVGGLREVSGGVAPEGCSKRISGGFIPGGFFPGGYIPGDFGGGDTALGHTQTVMNRQSSFNLPISGPTPTEVNLTS